jgi:hypothetical protein
MFVPMAALWIGRRQTTDTGDATLRSAAIIQRGDQPARPRRAPTGWGRSK